MGHKAKFIAQQLVIRPTNVPHTCLAFTRNLDKVIMIRNINGKFL